MGGLTRGAFYHHFKSKEEVFDALCEKLFYESNPFEKAKSHKELNGWTPQYSGVEGLKKGLKITADWFTKEENLKQYKADVYNL